MRQRGAHSRIRIVRTFASPRRAAGEWPLARTRETTMPRDKDLKRLVRSRMRKTGESYTAARSNLVTRSKRHGDVSARNDSERSESARSESARSDASESAGSESVRSETATPAPFTAHVVSPARALDKEKGLEQVGLGGERDVAIASEKRVAIEKGKDDVKANDIAKRDVATGRESGKRKDVGKGKDVEKGKRAVRKKDLGSEAASEEKNYATIAGMSDATIREKTGHGWEEWVRIIDEAGGAKMSHGDRASLVNETHGIDGWWSQCVTVGYERLRGMRARGQRMDGSWEATKSRTFDVPLDALFQAWSDGKVRKRWLGEPAAKVRTATAPKSMRLQFPDGTIVAIGFYERGKSKSVAAVQHTKLPDGESAQRMKSFWGESMDTLAELLEGAKPAAKRSVARKTTSKPTSSKSAKRKSARKI